jgi:hypothetical protein
MRFFEEEIFQRNSKLDLIEFQNDIKNNEKFRQCLICDIIKIRRWKS